MTLSHATPALDTLPTNIFIWEIINPYLFKLQFVVLLVVGTQTLFLICSKNTSELCKSALEQYIQKHTWRQDNPDTISEHQKGQCLAPRGNDQMFLKLGLSYVLCLCLVAQSCLTLWDPKNCSPPGSSVHEDSPGQNTGISCHALLQGIFPTQGLNSGLPHCRRILYQLSHQGSSKLGSGSMRSKILGNTDYRPVNEVPFSKTNLGGPHSVC